MQVKIKRISRKDTDKDGNKLLGKKDQKPYFKIGIQTEEHGDEWLSGFANSTTDPRYLMEEGGTYSIAVEEKKVGDKIFKNFRMLSAQEKELEELRALKATLGQSTTPNPGRFEPINETQAETDEGVF